MQTYGPKDIDNVERKERPDGSGDLTFARTPYRDSDGHQQFKGVSFVGIPDVRAVEKLLRDLKASESS